MNKNLYQKLAVSNLKKNYRTYIPYLLSCIGTITMFYMMHAISINKGLDSMKGSASLKCILMLGTYVIAIFSAILLFYTNSFLMKRRKKEIGLYNILGMEKKHISKMLFFETLYSMVISMVLGLLCGIIMYKLIFLVLLNLLKFPVPLQFTVSVPSLIYTLILFGLIFLVSLFFNLFQIHLSNPIELLNGSKTGEKEPKTKWIMAIIGVICLSIGYYIALTTDNPLQAFSLFFIAVILVIVGTYALFTAGSIALLKMLRKKKNFYYKSTNFINISGMIYRMKQNAAGLANICILSTMVLVMLSTTISLYFGMDDVLDNAFSKDIEVKSTCADDSKAQNMKTILEKDAAKYQITIKNQMEYRSSNIYYDINSDEDKDFIYFMTVDQYNQLEGTNVKLNKTDALLFTAHGKYTKNQIQICNYNYNIKDRLEKFPTVQKSDSYIMDVFYIVLANENDILSITNKCNKKDEETKFLSYHYLFDIDGSKDAMVNFSVDTKNKIKKLGDTDVFSKQESAESFYAAYGGLFFLGIFLGILFLSATVLIIYYKQISEGFDDRERFQIMKKVGMSKNEIQHSIRSQILGVFFLPLAMAVVHIAFAFKIITKLLNLLNLANVKLFFQCTVGTVVVFAMIYGVVYVMTAKVYYKIVSK